MNVDEELLLLSQTKKHVDRELKCDPDALRRFLHADKLLRDISSASEGSTTCSGFCLFYLLSAGLVGPGSDARGYKFLTDDELSAMWNALGASIVSKHAATTPRSGTTDLPNQYNSTIQLAGYLRASRLLSKLPPPDVVTTCNAIVDKITSILTPDGAVPRIGNAATPSAYLTFWTCAALDEFLETVGAHAGARAATERMASWSERELATGIAYHDAGLTSQFDVIGLAYSAMTAVPFQRTPQTFALARYAIDLLFKSYFADGCFARSAPVLATEKNFSLLCPTVEALALAFNPKPSMFFDEHGTLRHDRWEPLGQASLWLAEHRLPEGWYPEGDGRHGRPNGFMIASALAFLVGLSEVLDDVACKRASHELAVPPFAVDEKLKKIPYPKEVGRILDSHVIKPRSKPDLIDQASYSMILYGPPGSAKTTVAGKVAQDLGWPFLELHQSHFLRQGPNSITAEAERIFNLVSHLKKVVVLVDELEELVEERGVSDKGVHDKFSRLLTTSMLPLIHELRDARRIVFIFATNHVHAIDTAVSRLGRFDIVRCVPPPEEDERKKILQKLLDDNAAEPNVRARFNALNVSGDPTRNFGFKDLEALVRNVLVAVRVDGKIVDDALIEKFVSIGTRAIDKVQFDEYVKSSKGHDRP